MRNQHEIAEQLKAELERERAKPALEALAELMGEEFARLQRKHDADIATLKTELVVLRAELFRAQADVAAVKIAPFGDVERMLARFEERLNDTVDRFLPAASTTSHSKLPH
jgi:hypothetical protein